jgi:transposase
MDEKVNNYYPGRIKSVSLMMAVTSKRVIHYKFKIKTNKGEDFVQFLNDLNTNIENDPFLKNQKNNNLLWLYCDNASLHWTKEAKEIITNLNLYAIYGVAYRPELNMIESCFSTLKDDFYKRLVINEYVLFYYLAFKPNYFLEILY